MSDGPNPRKQQPGGLFVFWVLFHTSYFTLPTSKTPESVDDRAHQY